MTSPTASVEPAVYTLTVRSAAATRSTTPATEATTSVIPTASRGSNHRDRGGLPRCCALDELMVSSGVDCDTMVRREHLEDRKLSTRLPVAGGSAHNRSMTGS